MRLVVAGLLVALAASGCLEPRGHGRWDEPALPAWLQQEGAAAGFVRTDPPAGLPPSPALAQAIPAGDRLSSVFYTGGQVQLQIVVGHAVVRGPADEPTDDVVDQVEAALGMTFRGDAAGKDQALAAFGRAWEAGNGTVDGLIDQRSLVLGLAGPWDFDGVLAAGAPTFTAASAGASFAEVGSWQFWLACTTWEDGALEADAHGRVEGWGPAEDEQQYKAWVRKRVPGFPWAFEGLEFFTSHGL